MTIRYDPVKAAANIRKHGVSFADTAGVFDDPLALTIADLDSSDEQRFITIGLGSAGELLLVVWADRNGDCRVISARRPTRKERKTYES